MSTINGNKNENNDLQAEKEKIKIEDTGKKPDIELQSNENKEKLVIEVSVQKLKRTDLPIAAFNRKTQMIFLRKLYIFVIIQTLITNGVLALIMYEPNLHAWIIADHHGLMSFGIAIGSIVVLSLIVTFIPYKVRYIYVCAPFLLIFSILMGFCIGGLGNPFYMFTLNFGFIFNLIQLFFYTYFVVLEFKFWINYTISSIVVIVYIILIDGVYYNNYIAIIPLTAGQLFWEFYAIMFSQFILAFNSEMYRLNDYIFGALKFNVDMGDIMGKIALKYFGDIVEKLYKRYIKRDNYEEEMQKEIEKINNGSDKDKLQDNNNLIENKENNKNSEKKENDENLGINKFS